MQNTSSNEKNLRNRIDDLEQYIKSYEGENKIEKEHLNNRITEIDTKLNSSTCTIEQVKKENNVLDDKCNMLEKELQKSKNELQNSKNELIVLAIQHSQQQELTEIERRHLEEIKLMEDQHIKELTAVSYTHLTLPTN